MTFKGLILTDLGKKMILSEINDRGFKNLEFTKVSFGNGISNNLYNDTLELENEIISVKSPLIYINQTNFQVILSGILDINDDILYNNITEIGVFIYNPYNGQEVLFAYQTTNLEFYTDLNISEIEFKIYINLTSKYNEDLIISDSPETISRPLVQNSLAYHNRDENAHLSRFSKTIYNMPIATRLKYNGNFQTPKHWYNFDENKLTKEEDAGISAGRYYSYFTPKAGYFWWDGTTETKEFVWSIERAKPFLSIVPSQYGYFRDKDNEEGSECTINATLLCDEYYTFVRKRCVMVLDKFPDEFKPWPLEILNFLGSRNRSIAIKFTDRFKFIGQKISFGFFILGNENFERSNFIRCTISYLGQEK